MNQSIKESTATAIPLESRGQSTSPAQTGVGDWGVEWMISPERESRPRPHGVAFVTLLTGIGRTNWESASTVVRDHLTSKGSTQTRDIPFLLEEQSLVRYFDKLIHDSVDDVFFDGMESELSRQLMFAVETYEHIAIRAIDRLLDLNQTDVEAVGEILRQLGSMENTLTHASRLTILINKLQSSDPRIRDAASLGLAALDDSAAISAIQSALERESYPELRESLELVRDQLQST